MLIMGMSHNEKFQEALVQLGVDYKENKKGRIIVADADRRTADKIVFDSMIEKDAYLMFKEAFGKSKFVIQPKFLLQPGFTSPSGEKIRPIYYVADFAFFTKKKEFDKSVPAKVIVVDIKGMLDPVFKLKQKLFTYKFNKNLYLPKTKKHIKELIEIIKQHESSQSKNKK